MRVADTSDEDDVDCSARFTLVASAEVPSEGESGGPMLEVILPLAEDEFVVGEEGIVKVRLQ